MVCSYPDADNGPYPTYPSVRTKLLGSTLIKVFVIIIQYRNGILLGLLVILTRDIGYEN